MDWNKLNQYINEFVDKYGIRIEEFDTTFLGGQISTHQLNENSTIFYELKLSKPIKEYGSKLRIYSKATSQLSIKVKTRFIGKTTIKSNSELPDSLRKQLLELSSKIGSFEWTNQQHHSGWPNNLKNFNVLKFECKQIELATTQLEAIRQTHLTLLGNNYN